MKRIVLSVVLLFGAVGLMIGGTSGCNSSDVNDVIKKNKESIIKVLKLASKSGAKIGLKKWADKDPAAAKEAAAALARNLKDVILPYLDGEELHTSAEINEFINSSLFKNIPDEVKDAITAAAIVLDIYLPVPGSDKLTEDQRDYLKAFLSGIQEATAEFESGTFSAEQRYWITGESKVSSVSWLK